MSEEQLANEEEAVATAETFVSENGAAPALEEEATAATEDKRKRSGPGFLRGVVLGAIVGAIAAVVFSPRREDEAGAFAAGEGGALGGVGARIREAAAEAGQAAREAEERKRARFVELTEQD